ncbi:hypothetical protein SLE2022_263960 [Rubroshorea leprosula]
MCRKHIVAAGLSTSSAARSDHGKNTLLGTQPWEGHKVQKKIEQKVILGKTLPQDMEEVVSYEIAIPYTDRDYSKT